MKHCILLIIGLLLFTNCQTETPDNEVKQESNAIIEAAQSDSKVKNYSGTIEGKFPIEVQLVTEGNRIQGFYLYRKGEILLPIKGVKKENNKFKHEQKKLDSTDISDCVSIPKVVTRIFESTKNISRELNSRMIGMCIMMHFL